jgi:hypothetical protein
MIDFSGSRWRKPSRSGSTGSNCVEVATADAYVGVRDSKDPDGPTLMFDRSSFRRLVGEIRTGGHDL